MKRYIITNTDVFGERHQLGGAWEAENPEAAIAQMLAEVGMEDEGGWEAWPVTSDRDIIEQGRSDDRR
jgi:hypothetical protein